MSFRDEGYVTPPRTARCFGTAGDLVSVEDYDSLSRYDGWTSDSQNNTWMANFQDFIGNNSSDEKNSNWMLLEPEGDMSSDGESLYLADYNEYIFIDSDQRVAAERIRHCYRDSEWGHSSSTLLGDRVAFTGDFPGPTQRFRRKKMPPRHFFDMFW